MKTIMFGFLFKRKTDSFDLLHYNIAFSLSQRIDNIKKGKNESSTDSYVKYRYANTLWRYYILGLNCRYVILG